MIKPYPAAPGDTWEAVTSTRGGFRVRRRTVLAMNREAKTMEVEEDGVVSTLDPETFRKWINSFGAVKVDTP